VHGFTLDEFGRKMSKSLGNVVEPEDVIEQVGVDSFRLYVLSSALWEDLRFNWEEVRNLNRMLNIYWNTVRFAYMYMSLDKFREQQDVVLNIEDKWILSRLESLSKIALKAFESYQLHKVVKAFVNFIVEDFSRWYIQLIRPRVWEEKDSPSKIAAYTTILRVVDKTAKIIAPFIPFLAEWIYQHFIREFRDARKSIFLESYPEPEERFISEELEKKMEVVKEICEAASNARQKAKIKLRWPLRRLLIESESEEVVKAVEELKVLIKAQCNVKEVEMNKIEKKTVLKPRYKVLGPLLREKAKEFADYISSLADEEVKKAIELGFIEFKGLKLNVTEVLSIEQNIPEGYEAAEFSKGLVYLHTLVDEELKRESYAREVVRRVQEMRKELDLDVDKFIEVTIEMNPELVEGWQNYIKTETRAVRLAFEKPNEGYIKEWKIRDIKVIIGVKVRDEA
jgi:isoleucyl-tRNA synthetase